MEQKNKRGRGRPKKNQKKLETLDQAHGMDERIKKAKELEDLIGLSEINPYGTSIASEFEARLNEMALVDMQEMAVRAGVFPNGNKTSLKSKLLKGFNEYNRGSVLMNAPQPIKLKNKNSKDVEDALRLMREGL